MIRNRKSNRNQEMKYDKRAEGQQNRDANNHEEDRIDSEKLRYKNADEIYE
ncbi:hypothetical protein F3157_04050 [Virgibacillus dakarensis]|uniref:Uncharacterized protein n=1 Tax=Lentibacillus populi TaxID=1827502 RepID=A0A9W5TVN5_9BACI|nr:MULTISPECIES: hypothetical protein [Bacillaceae]MBT2214956.1 hypothetical protein [Virgibacillus dakarensis]MTW84830.1 hypothetical protein [Virgibacillus dakarensis]GGB31477.1 hypothetical protein GCM10011409_06090 [Lentibacillus populi]